MISIGQAEPHPARLGLRLFCLEPSERRVAVVGLFQVFAELRLGDWDATLDDLRTAFCAVTAGGRARRNMDTKTGAAFYDQRLAQEFAGPLKLKRAVAILNELSRLKLKQPRIIDVGCGSGWMTGVLSQWGPAAGVDWSPAAVESARQRCPAAEFHVVDLRVWQPPTQYDLAVCQEVIEHFDGDDQSRFVDTLASALRPGGHLILTTDNAATFAAMPEAERNGWMSQPIEQTLTLGSLRRALARRFDVQRLTSIIPGYGRTGLHRFAALSHRKLRALDPLWLRVGFGLHALAVAQRRA